MNLKDMPRLHLEDKRAELLERKSLAEESRFQTCLDLARKTREVYQLEQGLAEIDEALHGH